MFSTALGLVALLAGVALLILPTGIPELSRSQDRWLGIVLVLLLPVLLVDQPPLISSAGLGQLCAAGLLVGLGVEVGLARWHVLAEQQRQALRTRKRWQRSRDDLLDALARAWNKVHAFVVQGKGTPVPSAPSDHTGPAAAEPDAAPSNAADPGPAGPAVAKPDGADGADSEPASRSLPGKVAATWLTVRQLFAKKKSVGKLWKRSDGNGKRRDVEHQPAQHPVDEGESNEGENQAASEVAATHHALGDDQESSLPVEGAGQHEQGEAKAEPTQQQPDVVTVEPEPLSPDMETAPHQPVTTEALTSDQPSDQPPTDPQLPHHHHQPDVVIVEPEPLSPDMETTPHQPVATEALASDQSPADPQPQPPATPESGGEDVLAATRDQEQQGPIAVSFEDVNAMIEASQTDVSGQTNTRDNGSPQSPQ